MELNHNTGIRFVLFIIEHRAEKVLHGMPFLRGYQLNLCQIKDMRIRNRLYKKFER